MFGWGREINVQAECQFLTQREELPVFCLQREEPITKDGPKVLIDYILVGFFEPNDHWGQDLANIQVKRDILDMVCANESCGKLSYLFSGWFVDSIDWISSK